MTEKDRIIKVATDNGWRPSGLSAMTFSKHGKTAVSVRFADDGSVRDARIEGREVARSKAAAVIQHLRQG